MARLSENSQSLFFTGFLTQISCWALHELLEKNLGMEPKVITSDALRRASITKHNPEKSFEINSRYCSQTSSQISTFSEWSYLIILFRLTKSLTVDGEYRMQNRAAIYFVKALYSLILCVTFITACIVFPHWFQEHFIDLKAESNKFQPLLYVSATLVGFYS